MEKVRLGIIGAGSIGTVHMDIFSRLPRKLSLKQ